MNSETKQCQACSAPISISTFGKEILHNLDLPVPAYCESCGLRSLMALRNERTLYSRACDHCKKKILSMYPSETLYTVYCPECWWGDSWDGISHGLEYKGPETFFDQMVELQKMVPRQALITLNVENCDYSNHIRDSKDCYMVILATKQCERDFYCYWIVHLTDSVDCYYTIDSERCYRCIATLKTYGSSHLLEANNCVDCHYCYDIQGCTNCMFSSNLRNKSYVFENQQLTKQEYELRTADIVRGSFQQSEEYAERWMRLIEKSIHRYANQFKCQDSTGDNLQNCVRAEKAWSSFDAENIYNVVSGLSSKNIIYGFSLGTQPVEWSAHSAVIKGGTKVIGCFNSAFSSDVYFCDSIVSSNDCLGCVGLNKKQFCILNKQYEKEQYLKIKDELLAYWKKSGTLTMSLPRALYTFKYNESAAQDFFAFNKDEALKFGYNWQDVMPGTFKKETKPLDAIPDAVDDISDDLLKEIFACIECKKNYKFIKGELNVYRLLKAPLPRNCFDCRVLKFISLLGGKTLYERQCTCAIVGHDHGAGRCTKKFATKYKEGASPEKVYCEQCYQAEVV